MLDRTMSVMLCLLGATTQILAVQDNPKGSIVGRVIDAETKSAVKGATITILKLGLTTVTDSGGRFSVSGLAQQSYKLRIFKDGFERNEIYAYTDSTASEIELLLTPLPFRYQISGRVVDASTSSSLARAGVRLRDSMVGTSTDTSGRFIIDKLSKETYTIEVSCIGYKRKTVTSSSFTRDDDNGMEVRLEPEPIKLSEVVVSPGTFSISRLQTSEFQFTKEELKLTPTGIDDPLRALQLLPGINTDFVNAKVGIRGSKPEDALYVIDGVEIFGSIFHMDRLQGSHTAEMNGLISILNSNIIDNIYLSLGGFPSSYGNKSGGVVALETKSPQSPGLKGDVTLNIAKVGGLLEGRFGNNFLVLSGERGYFDLAFSLLGAHTNLRPRYSDLFGKYEYRFQSGRVFLEALHADDWIDFTSDPSSDSVVSSTDYSLTHVWAGFDYLPSVSVLSRTIIYSSFLPEKTSYDASTPAEPDFLTYRKRAILYGIKETFFYDISSEQSIEAGVNAKYTRSRYSLDQTYQASLGDTIKVVSSEEMPNGYDVGAYASFKTKLLESNIVIDAGFRLDYQSYIERGAHQISPRIGVAASLPYQTKLRIGAGLYYQPVDIANIQNYSPQAFRVSKSTHYLLSLENRYFPLSDIRIEGYYKRMPPEINGIFRFGRYAHANYGYAYGVDTFVKKQFNRWLFWCGYSYGMARDVVEELVIYRSSDRRHSLSASAYLALPAGWDLGVTYRFATARPYTAKSFETVRTDSGAYWIPIYGFPNGSRGTDFSQLNLTVNKSIDLSWGKLSGQIQLINVLDSQGVVAYKWKFVSDNFGGRFIQNNTNDFPFFVTFGLTFEF
jgi:hypothetical protein